MSSETGLPRRCRWSRGYLSTGGAYHLDLASRVAAIRRVVGKGDAGELRYVASRLIGRVRLLTGMVRANRPGRALLGLSKLLVGAFGTAAFALTTNTIWQMGDALGGLRLAVIMLLGLTAMVA